MSTEPKQQERTEADVVVVGLGIHGRAAALELARRGARVVALDQFPDGHTRGSSHGTTRMIRRAYPNPAWNDLVGRAFDGWDRWARAAGHPFIHTTGGLYAHPGEPGLQGPGCRAVTRAEAARLMPSFDVPEGHGIVYDPSAGVLEAARAMEFAAAAARAQGAELSHGERMLSWRQDGEGVEVVTEARTLRAGKLVLATGAWVAQAVPELARQFEVWRIVTLTAGEHQEPASPPLLGTFSVDRPEGLLFGIPDVAGHGFKVGVDAGPVWDPDIVPAAPSGAEIADLEGLMERHVPGTAAGQGAAVSCLYTMTPDKRFVIGALDDAPDVLVVAACSGHGFKFGPAVGEAAADLCLGVERPDLDFLSPGRFAAAER